MAISQHDTQVMKIHTCITYTMGHTIHINPCKNKLRIESNSIGRHEHILPITRGTISQHGGPAGRGQCSRKIFPRHESYSRFRALEIIGLIILTLFRANLITALIRPHNATYSDGGIPTGRSIMQGSRKTSRVNHLVLLTCTSSYTHLLPPKN